MSHRHISWWCPFFYYDTKEYIACEGGTRVRFESNEQLQEYAHKYCATPNGCYGCSIALTLFAKYEEDGTNGEKDTSPGKDPGENA